MAERGRIILGLVLLAAGGLFLLDAVDVIDAWSVVGSWWPAVLIVLGIVALVAQPRSLISGGILIVVGLVLLSATLNFIDISVWQLLIPALLIAAGLGLVLRGLYGGGTTDTSNSVTATSVLSEQRVNSRATAFKSATLTALLGDVTLDLRQAQLDHNGAIVDTFCALGDVNVVVPHSWRVRLEGMPILADFEDNTHQDYSPDEEPPTVTITGVSLLGDVEVKNE